MSRPTREKVVASECSRRAKRYICEYEGVVLHRGRALRLRQQPPKEEAAREGPQHEAGKRNRDGRAGVTCNFAARGGRRLDARHAPAHAQDETRASIRPDIINTGAELHCTAQREWPHGPRQAMWYKNSTFSCPQVEPLI